MLMKALNRTLLLMGTALRADCSLEGRLDALAATRVVICADRKSLDTAAGQTALVTASILMARSGHEVWVDASPVAMIEPQPPLQGAELLESLVELGRDLLPDRELRLGKPVGVADLVVIIGEPGWTGEARQIVGVNAGDGWGSLDRERSPWRGDAQPFGAMAAGALAAGEAFKSAMRRVSAYALSPSHFDEEFAPTASCTVTLAPEGPIFQGALPPADIVSGGAIGNALVFALLRAPAIEGVLGLLDDDRNDLTNLNRNVMLRRSQEGAFKVESLASQATGRIRLTPHPLRYEAGVALATSVLIGVDHIPSRWAAQATGPSWIGVGATAGFCVQVSEHAAGQACAGCLHPDEGAGGTGPIPTAAFVSFWAGLLLAVRWLRHLGGLPDPHQQSYFSPLRPEGWIYSGLGVAAHPGCPVGCTAATRPANDTGSSLGAQAV
jgi:hypothetical protein